MGFKGPQEVLRIGLLAAALLAAAAVAQAGNAITNATVSAEAGPPVSDQDQSIGGTAHSSIEAQWHEAGSFGEGSASASAGDGFVKAFGSGAAFGSSSQGWTAMGAGSGHARFVENLTFLSAAHAGMPGQVTVSAIFGATLTAFGLAQSGASFSLNVGGSNAIVFSQIQAAGMPPTSQLLVNDAGGFRDLPYASIAYMTFDVVWGETLQIVLDLLAEGHTNEPISVVSGASADAAHSGYWGGVVSATAGGAAITDFSVVSSTGLDYRSSFAPTAPVPEPESLALLAAGLAAMWGRLRRANRPRIGA